MARAKYSGPGGHPRQGSEEGVSWVSVGMEHEAGPRRMGDVKGQGQGNEV